MGGAAASSGGAGSAGTMGAGGRSTLSIYWIDVEGGGATLLVAPSGQTLLIDAGFSGSNGRDLDRVLAAVHDQAKATRLDYVITTHYHIDHVGGVISLVGKIPVGEFWDHGETVESAALYTNYVNAIAGQTRHITKPGEKITLGEVEITVVTAAGMIIDPPLSTAIANPHCSGAAMMPERPTDENPKSVGVVVRFGSFDFSDLGDLTWQVEDRLVCPTNRIGLIDLFQVNHHGLNLSSSPQLVHGLAPLVAVMNNGATKGGSPEAFESVTSSPGLQALYQMHLAIANDAAHNSNDALIANLPTSPDGAFLKAEVARDGTFTMTNSRNNQSRVFKAR
ncbi:MAG: MBL fold metallo-hydrolase [Opitutaceae bacterium]